MNPHDPHAHAQPVQQADEIQWSKVIAVAVGSVIAFALCITLSTIILNTTSNAERDQAGLAAVPTSVPIETGIINQRPFVLDPRAAITRDGQLAYLHSYGWVDRKAKTIHIPIDQAMAQIVAQQGAGPKK